MSTAHFIAMITAGWALTHPVILFVFGGIAALVVAAAAVALADDRADQRRYEPRHQPAGRPPARHAAPLGVTLLMAAPRTWRWAGEHAMLGAFTARAWARSWLWWTGSVHPWQAGRERLAHRRRLGAEDARTVALMAEMRAEDTGGLAAAAEPDRCDTCERFAGHVGWCEPRLAAESSGAVTPAGVLSAEHELGAAPGPDPEPSPWEHETGWFSLDAIDAELARRGVA